MMNSVSMVIGIPGSGKSYYGVNSILKDTSGLPIFTNIPIHVGSLQMYVEKRYRRPAPELYILTQQHFTAFTERLAKIRATIESLQRSEPGIDPTDAYTRAHSMVCESDGEDQYSGPMANWLPSNSILYLDELQNWFPATGYKHEDRHISAYFTMHRHLKHTVYVFTQRANLCSLSIRAMTATYTFCYDKSRIPFVHGLRLPWKWFQYLSYPKEFVPTSGLAPSSKVSPTEVEYARCHNEVFALYESFSVAGAADSRVTEAAVKAGKVKGRRRLWPWVVAAGAILLFFMARTGRPKPDAVAPVAPTEKVVSQASETPGRRSGRVYGPQNSPDTVRLADNTTYGPRIARMSDGFRNPAEDPTQLVPRPRLAGVASNGKLSLSDGTILSPGQVWAGAMYLATNGRTTVWSIGGRTVLWRVGDEPIALGAIGR